MNFNSGTFLLFLPAVTIVYWLIPHGGRRYWLLAASYFFYMYANPALIALLLVSTAVDYCCGLGIERFRGRRAVMKALLLVSVCVNLGLLFTFKYFDFFARTVNDFCAAAGLLYRVPELGLILPVGISFYTFQTMSYTIDVYRGEFNAERDLVTFALYVAYFPQLVAGPIESPKNLLPQLHARHRLCWADFSAGIRLLICGFFRKCAVADLCGIYVNRVFADLNSANSLSILLAGGLFCIQMYCDFAGYSEIAAGSARLMGVRLMRNFNRPYLAQSYTEFFRRWHISLNRWFTDYVYIPLGGSRRGPVRRALNTVTVFALCGLWHGARWTYVLWGLYAAFFVCAEGLLSRLAPKLPLDGQNPVVKLARRCCMFLIFIPAALLFRAESVEQLGLICMRIAAGGVSVNMAFAQMGLSGYALIHLVLALTAMARLYQWEEYEPAPARTAQSSARRLVSAVYLVLITATSWLALLETQGMAGFAYFQF